jgi:hypothetical protein
MRLCSVAALALALLGNALQHAAVAQPTQAQAAAIRSACPADYQTYCAGVPTGGAQSLDCLKKNVAKLSSACQTAVNAATGTAAAPPASGGTGQAAPSGGTTGQSTSPPAQTGSQTASTPPPASSATLPLLTPRQEIFLVRNACRADVRKLCGGVPLGGGRVIECLELRKSSLSQRCVAAIATVRNQ